ncbi:iron chelate uptake ABC transporter family permease subunit [Staphylococcus aureus]
MSGITTALIIFIFSFNKNEGVTPASMVLIGVGLQTALYGGSITIMSKFDDKQSDFIAAWFAGNIWVTNGHLSLHFYRGCPYHYSLLTI